MSMSLYASFSDYKNGVSAVSAAIKPEVDIENASIVTWLGGKQILCGVPSNHPNQRLNGDEITSSSIVSVDGPRVETRNTVYNVVSWAEGYEPA